MPDVAPAVRFRMCQLNDMTACAIMESNSYPAQEAASKDALLYRLHHCSRYFRCAVIGDDDNCTGSTVIGFVCGTKCNAFTHESMSEHDETGKLLAVHSVVVKAEYRRQGIATRMLQDYISTVQHQKSPPEQIVLLAKAHLLAFYVKCGFQVM